MHGLLTGVAFALAAVLCWRLLRAGRLQLAGRLPEARREARGNGMGTSAACAVLALLLALQGGPGGGAAAAALGAGACALLGGLSGKPVPSAWFAAGLLAASLALLAAC